MNKRVSFSGEHLGLTEIAEHFNCASSAIREYHSPGSPTYATRFFGLSTHEVSDKLQMCLDELEKAATLSVFACIEANVRLDYLQRTYERRKDALSRLMRTIHKQKNNNASLTDDLLPAWKVQRHAPDALVNQIIAAFKYRHWLAHGRYWTWKAGVIPDYYSAHSLANDFLGYM